MIYAYSENFILPFSHDEVVHGKRSLLDKMPGDEWQKRATLRLLFAYMFAHPGKKLLFMGAEFGQWREWNHDTSLDWQLLDEPGHAGLQRVVRDLNRLYCREPALHQRDHQPDGFRWIDCTDNENSIVSVLRTAADPADHVVAVFNFTPVPRRGYAVGVPHAGFYREVLNTDSAAVRRQRRRQPRRPRRPCRRRRTASTSCCRSRCLRSAPCCSPCSAPVRPRAAGRPAGGTNRPSSSGDGRHGPGSERIERSADRLGPGRCRTDTRLSAAAFRR